MDAWFLLLLACFFVSGSARALVPHTFEIAEALPPELDRDLREQLDLSRAGAESR